MANAISDRTWNTGRGPRSAKEPGYYYLALRGPSRAYTCCTCTILAQNGHNIRRVLFTWIQQLMLVLLFRIHMLLAINDNLKDGGQLAWSYSSHAMHCDRPRPPIG